MEDLPEVPPPTTVELDRDSGLTVEWPDGTTARFELGDLREACPCAQCRGLREQDRLVVTDAGRRAEGADLVGNWGITIRWADGHQTGIYAWGLLHTWAKLGT
jgi:DUF971 family protein